MVKSCIAFTLASALVLQPHAAHAAEFSAKQLRTLDTIVAGRNDARKLDDAVALAREVFDQEGQSMGFRKAVAREGKAVAVLLFERDKSDPERAAAASNTLCWAIDVMRIYEAELASSAEERQKFSSEAARLLALATDVKAPCAPPPPPPVVVAVAEPSAPIVTVRPPQATGEAGDRREGPEPPAARRSRLQLAVGATLVTTSIGLAAGLAGCFAAARGVRAEIAGLDAQATADGRDLTSGELAAAAAADARGVRLHNTGTALGVFAALGVVAGVVTLVLPPRAPARVHARPVGAGVRINF